MRVKPSTTFSHSQTKSRLLDKLRLPSSHVDDTDGQKSHRDSETDLSLAGSSKMADRSLSPIDNRQFAYTCVNNLLNARQQARQAAPNQHNNKYKTELCKNFGLYGQCKWGNNCFFAHGKAELKSKTQVNNFYKTKICKHFHRNGFCPYASRCQYFHFKSYQIYQELLDSFENKLNCRLAETECGLADITSKVERMQPRLAMFKKLSRGDTQRSLQEKFLADEF